MIGFIGGRQDRLEPITLASSSDAPELENIAAATEPSPL
jgi:hypothetical protein